MHIYTLGEVDSCMRRLSRSWRLRKLLTQQARLERGLLLISEIREGLEPWTGRVNLGCDRKRSLTAIGRRLDRNQAMSDTELVGER